MSTSEELSKRSGEEHLHRGGVLQSTEHGPPAVPVEYLLAFVRSLIRIHPSCDAIALATAQAGEAFPLTEEQSKAFQKAVSHEAEQTMWPKGFF